MRHSTDRILVSHAGNLPRPPELDASRAEGQEPEAFQKALPDAVRWIVDRQIECGVDVVNDGEYPKGGGYTGYMQERVTGFGMVPTDPSWTPKRAGVGERDRRDFPGTSVSGLWLAGSGGAIRPGFMTPGGQPFGGGGGGFGANTGQTRVAKEPIKYIGHEKAKADAERLKAAIAGKPVEGLITALGPMSLGAGTRNVHYKSEEEYLMAVAEACREEYKTITDAGLNVQIDEPEFCTDWMFYPEWDVAQYRKYLEMFVEVINHSLEGIPEDKIRFHTCWGSGHRPHVNDIELRHIADIMVKIKAQMYSVEAANVRHEHEWMVWKDVKLPAGKILEPGVISHATDLVEHPELIAQRLVNYASVVGKENVQTGTDCGIGSRVGHEEIVWAKLKAMSAGAAIASRELWGK